MSKKHFGRFVIVLFLLAALPGMTAVMAQGQEPAKEAPADSVTPASPADWGETPLYYSIWENEPNNSKAAAQQVNIISPPPVIGGDVFNGDVDWYKFYVPATATGVLINTDAMMDGEDTDTVLKLFDNSAATEPMLTNDDMGTGQYDSLLFAVLDVGWYYVQVSDHPSGGNCVAPDSCFYELLITRPILISAAAAGLGTGNVEGIPFRSEDVMALILTANDYANQPQHKWILFFDGSDVGVIKPVVNVGLGWVHDDGKGSLSISFGANQVWEDWQGLNRTFKPWDWAQIAFGRVGPNTMLWVNELGNPGVEYHAGAEHGLTTVAEKTDAFDLNPSYSPSEPSWTADVWLSTAGAASTPKEGSGVLKTADEDVFRSTIYEGASAWRSGKEFDGSTVAGLGVEDVYAADYEVYAHRLFLTILGTGNVAGHAVTQKDIFWLDKSGSNWYWGGMWHLPDYGWNYNLDAIETGGN